jgi:hypothetical protein
MTDMVNQVTNTIVATVSPSISISGIASHSCWGALINIPCNCIAFRYLWSVDVTGGLLIDRRVREAVQQLPYIRRWRYMYVRVIIVTWEETMANYWNLLGVSRPCVRRTWAESNWRARFLIGSRFRWMHGRCSGFFARADYPFPVNAMAAASDAETATKDEDPQQYCDWSSSGVRCLKLHEWWKFLLLTSRWRQMKYLIVQMCLFFKCV